MSSRKKPPYMQFYPADYLRDTRMLDQEEKGFYTDLLFNMWLEGGELPNNDKLIARLLSVTPIKWKKMKEKLSVFFDFSEDFFTHKRIQRDMKKLGVISDMRAEIGRKGGQKKAGNSQSTVANATILLEQNSSKPPSKAVANTVASDQANTLANTTLRARPTQKLRSLEDKSKGGDTTAAHDVPAGTPPPPRKIDFSKKIPDHVGVGLEKDLRAGNQLSDIDTARLALWKQQKSEEDANNPAVQAKLEELRTAKELAKPKESADEDNPEPAWKAVKDDLRQKEGEDTYKSWLQQLRLAEMNDDNIIITAPTAFAVTWIEGKFLQKIEKSFALITERKRTVQVMLRMVA